MPNGKELYFANLMLPQLRTEINFGVRAGMYGIFIYLNLSTVPAITPLRRWLGYPLLRKMECNNDKFVLGVLDVIFCLFSYT